MSEKKPPELRGFGNIFLKPGKSIFQSSLKMPEISVAGKPTEVERNQTGAAMSLFEIKCPLCRGKLWIDPASGRVVDHRAADQQKSNFEDFLKNRQQGTAWDDKMKKAKEEEAKRKAEIEMKFKTAKETTETGEIEPLKSPLDWD